MTTINAMRFDEYSGMLVCDEARSWNDESGRLLTAEKIRLVTAPEVMEGTGVVALMGKTGTSTLGNEYLETTKDRITAEYRKAAGKSGEPLASFMTVREIAHDLYANLAEVKRKHVDQTLKARYGFTTNDFIAGFYESEKGEKVEITDKAIIDKVHKIITWEGMAAESRSIFLNAQIVAGYDPKEGFRIFRSSLIAPHCEPVHEIFTCDGSGVDSTDFVFSDFANTRTTAERRGKIDRVEGLAVLLEALNYANRNSAGCSGYLKIHYVNGREKNPLDRHREMHDGRCKLAQELVLGGTEGFLPWKKVYELLEGLIYGDRPFLEVNEAMKKASRNSDEMLDVFRGHRCHRGNVR